MSYSRSLPGEPMFGDVFGTRTDYAKGILYSSRQQYLAEGAPDLGPGWQDGDRVRAPRALMSKRQIRRELSRKRRASQVPLNLRHLPFLEQLQEQADRSQRARQELQRAKEYENKGSLTERGLILPPIDGATASLPENLVHRFRSSMVPRRSMEAGAAGFDRTQANEDLDYEEEWLQRERSAWQYVTGRGHPYWINTFTGAMQFESPFFVPEAEEQLVVGERDTDNSTFAFFEEWTHLKGPPAVTVKAG